MYHLIRYNPENQLPDGHLEVTDRGNDCDHPVKALQLKACLDIVFHVAENGTPPWEIKADTSHEADALNALLYDGIAVDPARIRDFLIDQYGYTEDEVDQAIG